MLSIKGRCSPSAIAKAQRLLDFSASLCMMVLSIPVSNIRPFLYCFVSLYLLWFYGTQTFVSTFIVTVFTQVIKFDKKSPVHLFVDLSICSNVYYADPHAFWLLMSQYVLLLFNWIGRLLLTYVEAYCTIWWWLLEFLFTFIGIPSIIYLIYRFQ